MATYFLQRPAGFWEQVDEFCYKNWKNAVDEEMPRYNGNRVFLDGGKVNLELVGVVTPKDLVLIARFCGAAATDLSPNVTFPGGTVKEPEFVQFKKNNQTILKKINGPKFVARAA